MAMLKDIAAQIASAAGPEATSHDVRQHLVEPRCVENRDLSFAEIELIEAPPGSDNIESTNAAVGVATHFVSYAWDYPFALLVDALESDVENAAEAYFWVDVLVVPQTRQLVAPMAW